MRNHDRVRNMVGIGIFTAIVIVLQLLGSFIRFGMFSISLVLIPIVVGAAVYGWGAGLWLGIAFGAAVLISGDASAFMAVSPLGTVWTVMAKGALAGLVSGCVYHLLQKRRTLAVTAAAVVCPIVNTGIFLLSCQFFFLDTIRAWGAELGFADVGSYMIFGLVGANFLAEMAVNVVLSPVIVRLISLGKKK